MFNSEKGPAGLNGEAFELSLDEKTNSEIYSSGSRRGQWFSTIVDNQPSNIRPLKQRHLDWLSRKDVPPEAVMHPALILLANGRRAPDGYFEYQNEGPDWLVFTQSRDLVFWRPSTGEIAWELGFCFALGEELIANPASTAFGPLAIYADPLEWLISKRQGIVVVQWHSAFEWLRDLPAVALAGELESLYRKCMMPRLPRTSRLPEAVR